MMKKMFKKKKQLSSLLFAFVTLVMVFPISAFAVEEELPTQMNVLKDDSLPDNEDLFAGYVQEVFYGDNGIALAADYGNEKLTGLDLAVY